MEFHAMTRRHRYIYADCLAVTTVGNLKAKIIDATSETHTTRHCCVAKSAEQMHLFFRGDRLANGDILSDLHSLTNDDSEVIVHACARDRIGQSASVCPIAVGLASKLLWSMGPGSAGWLVG